MDYGVTIDAWVAKGIRAQQVAVVFKRGAMSALEHRQLDKYGPLELGHGMIDLYQNDTAAVWLAGVTSDVVYGLHTRHADERGPNGELWNSYGHHSFKVTFRLTQAEVLPPVVVPPVLTIEQEIELLKVRVTALEGGQ